MSAKQTQPPVKKIHSTAEAIMKLNAYLTRDDNLPFDINILDYWKRHEFTELCDIALDHLIIPAGSVASERDASSAEYTINKRRARLNPENVKKILFLNRNLQFVNDSDISET